MPIQKIPSILINATTPASTDNSTNLATTQYVNNRLGIPIEKVTTLTPAESITVDPADGSLFSLTVDQDCALVLSSISNGYYTTNGAIITLFIPATSYVVSWSNNVTWVSGSAPDLSTEFNIITFVTPNGGATWYGNILEVQA